MIFLALLLAAARAGAPQALEPVETGVVVTGTRLDSDASALPARVVVLTRADLERSAALTLDDVLRSVPGFSPFRRASSMLAHPTTQGVSLRGLGGTATSRTLVLVDGRPLNDPFSSFIAWGRVPIASIERVEIVPAGVANTWGSMALAGVVNVVTRRDPHADVWLDAGERHSFTAEGSASGGKRFAWRVSSRAQHAGGWHVLAADRRGPIDEPPDADGAVIRAGVTADLSPRWRLDTSIEGFRDDRGNGTPGTSEATGLVEIGLRATLDSPRFGRFMLDASGLDETFSARFTSVDADRASERPALDQRVPATSAAFAATWSRELGEGARVAAGVDARRTDGTTHELFRLVGDAFTRTREAGGRTDVAGLFAQAAWTRGRVEIDLGLRADAWRASNGVRVERDQATGDTTREDDVANASTRVVSPRVGLLVQSSPRWSERVALSRGFRAPTLNEMHRPFRVRDDVTEANAALEPEIATTCEAGVDRSSHEWDLHVTGSVTDLEHLVANTTVGEGPGVIAPCGFIAAGGTCRVRRNVGTARVASFEVSGERRFERWTVAGDALWIETTMRDAPDQPELRGKRLAQVPQLQASLRLERRGASDAVALEVRHVSRAWEDDRNTLPLANAVLVDASWRRTLAPRWELAISAQNLLDERIESARTSDDLVTLGSPRLLHAGVRFRR